MDLTKIKAVFFDFDDTLGDREKYAYDCAKAILEENVENKDPIEFEAILQDWMIWDQRGFVNKNYVRDMLKKKYHIELKCKDLNQYWAENLWKHTVAFSDAAETLDYLKDKYKMGIITNGPSQGQRKKLETSGLKKYFDMDHVIVSGDYEFEKPDPRIFEAACQRLGVKPEECVCVGDLYGSDILGSYRAGMTPIWIWTSGERKQTADVLTIHHISDLKKVL